LPKITTKRPEIIGNRAPDKGVFYYNSFTGGNSIGGSSNDLPSGPPTPVPSPFKFVWFNRDIDLVPPSRPDASTGVAVTTRKPKRRKRPKRPRKHIKDRPRRQKKKNRKNRRRNRNRNRKNRRKNRRKSTTTTIPRLLPSGSSFDRELTTPPTSLTTITTTQRAPLIFTSPLPPAEDPEVHGFVSISFGNPEEDVNFNLGPGQSVHAMDKLKELEASLKCEGLSCLDVY
jgi:hypothetical protein